MILDWTKLSRINHICPVDNFWTTTFIQWTEVVLNNQAQLFMYSLNWSNEVIILVSFGSEFHTCAASYLKDFFTIVWSSGSGYLSSIRVSEIIWIVFNYNRILNGKGLFLLIILNKRCLEKRTTFHHVKRKYNTYKTDDSRHKLLLASKEYKTAMNQNFQDYQFKSENDLGNSCESQPKELWKLLDKMNSSSENNIDIFINELYEYFKI